MQDSKYCILRVPSVFRMLRAPLRAFALLSVSDLHFCIQNRPLIKGLLGGREHYGTWLQLLHCMFLLNR